MMKNILNIDIYLHRRIDRAYYVEKITALSKTVHLSNTFQKVQMNYLVFSESAR
jgi:hypothetical protein